MTQHQNEWLNITRSFSHILIRMSEWANELVTTFAASMKKRRDELGMSAQKLVDRTAELGHPVNRSVVAALESGRRNRLLLPDALVIAKALETSLATLLYPAMPDRVVEQVPGRRMNSWEAALELLGVEPLFGDIGVDNEVQHKAGHALVRAAAELEKEREEYYTLGSKFRAEAGKLDGSGLTEFWNKSTQIQRRMAELENRVLELGGVIDEGHFETQLQLRATEAEERDGVGDKSPGGRQNE